MRTIALVLLILSAVDILIAIETETKNINEGERVELKCTTHLQYPVVWHFRRSDGTHEIFLGGEISMTFKDMLFLTGNQSLGEYNLHIPSADGRYDGNYKCIDDEGLGSALVSIQLNIIASASTTDMQPIAEHSPDAENYESLKAAASIFQNNMHSNSITHPAVVFGIVLAVVIVVAIIIVAIRKWGPKRKGKKDANCPKAAEAQSPPRTKISDSSDSSITRREPDFFANPPLVNENTVESNAEKSNLLRPDFLPTGRPHEIVSQSSDSSGGSDHSEAQLIHGDKSEI